MLGRQQIGRADKNHAHPNHKRQPIFEEGFHSERKAGPRGSAEANAEHPTSNVERPMGTKESVRPVQLKVGRSTFSVGRLLSMTELHLTAPLTFEPFFVERMWGGRRLESEFGKKLPLQKRIGESWEIVDRPEAQSVVANGPLKGKTLHDLWRSEERRVGKERRARWAT